MSVDSPGFKCVKDFFAANLKAPHYWSECFSPLGMKLTVERGGMMREYFFNVYPIADNFGPNRDEYYKRQRDGHFERLKNTIKQALEDFK